ncbi:MAG: hypothetical protein ACMUEM_03220 [Flavobacteriales bacterium AspAUS03]
MNKLPLKLGMGVKGKQINKTLYQNTKNIFEATKAYFIKPDDVKLENNKFSVSGVPIAGVYKIED